MRDPATRDRPAAYFVSPMPGGPLAIAWADIRESIRLAPVWLHAGWIDVVWKFRRTKIGPFWHTLGLAAFVVVMGVVWSRILNQDPIAYFRYVSTNLITWSLISTLVTDGTVILINGQYTALAMRYPYIAFAIGHVWRSLLLFGHHFVLYAVVMVGTMFNPGPVALLAIPGLVIVLANGIWISLLAGMLSLRRRDASPAIASAMQIMLFVTPVLWPKDLLGPELAYWSDFNPFYHVLAIVRDPLLGVAPSLANWLWSCGALVVGGFLTLGIYGRLRDRLVYWY
jgi:ABC-type polysaccharide/polyol phosphate export permease